MRGVAATNPYSFPSDMSQNTSSLLHDLTVFCDFDGPIVDVSNRYYTTYRLGLADTLRFYQTQDITLPIQMLTKQQFWQMKQDRVPDVEIAMRSGLQGEEINFFLKRVVTIVNQPALLQQDSLQPAVSWALALLHSQGAKLVLVTLRCHLQAEQLLSHYGLSNLFSGIYGTEDCQVAYHNNAQLKTQLLEQAFSEQLQRIGHTVSAWMVGDTEADIRAGQALSIPTIALTCGIRSHFYLKQFHPTRICSDLLDAAHYLVETTQHDFSLVTSN